MLAVFAQPVLTEGAAVIEVLVHAFEEMGVAGTLEILGRVRHVHAFADGDGGPGCPDVVVLVAEDFAGAGTFRYLRRLHERYADQAPPRCVLIADGFRTEDALAAVEQGVFAFLYRHEVTVSSLVSVVLAVARGTAVVPGALQGALLAQLTMMRHQVLEPEGVTLFGLEVRERTVLKLVAEGHGTAEIAEQLLCSEGTVKKVLYGFMGRLGLNSRAHAVAHALRAGVI